MSETTVLPAEAGAAAREGAARASDEELIQELGRARARIRGEIAKRVVGQNAVIDQLLVALFSRGHCLFVGVPGLAKTLLISTLAEALSLTFNRIQFTPDLMPSDITGTDIITPRAGASSASFRDRSSPTCCSPTRSTGHRRRPRPRCSRRCRSTG